MTPQPLHLTESDFDAYLPERAASNAYSRPRLEVKQRALSWSKGVVSRLAELSISVDVHGSDEHPSLRNKKRVDCQWVFFWRDSGARDELNLLLERGRSLSDALDDPSPYQKHAFLGLRINMSSVEVCFAVHPEAKVDVDNLRARLATANSEASTISLARELTDALTALPDEFMVRVGDSSQMACSAATPESIAAMLQDAVVRSVPLWIGWTVPRETAVTHAEILDEQLEDALVALAPIYKLVAWSRQNDHIALDRRLEGVEAERARAHAEVQAQTERWQAEQAHARELAVSKARERAQVVDFRPASAPKRPTLSTLFKPQPKKAPDAIQALEVETEKRSAPLPQYIPAPGQAVEKGSRVRVLRGPFAEKTGIVAELDGRGSARVLLGLLSTRLEVIDLESLVDGRDRPPLQSSHRRPGSNGPRKTR